MRHSDVTVRNSVRVTLEWKDNMNETLRYNCKELCLCNREMVKNKCPYINQKCVSHTHSTLVAPLKKEAFHTRQMVTPLGHINVENPSGCMDKNLPKSKSIYQRPG